MLKTREVVESDLRVRRVDVPMGANTWFFTGMLALLCTFLIILASDWKRLDAEKARAGFMCACFVSLAVAGVVLVSRQEDLKFSPEWQTKKKVEGWLKKHPDEDREDWIFLSDFNSCPSVGVIRRSPTLEEKLEKLEQLREKYAELPARREILSVISDYVGMDEVAASERKLKKQIIDSVIELEDFIDKYGKFI